MEMLCGEDEITWKGMEKSPVAFHNNSLFIITSLIGNIPSLGIREVELRGGILV
jgi:hypothetical protein